MLANRPQGYIQEVSYTRKLLQNTLRRLNLRLRPCLSDCMMTSLTLNFLPVSLTTNNGVDISPKGFVIVFSAM